jgi:UDP-glucose 4-epimerase
MRTVVTGGAGFIGSNLVDRLLAIGHEVAVIDDFSRGRWENLASAASRAGNLLQVIEADICDSGIGGKFPTGTEVIFHLAAQIDVRKSVLQPQFDASVNILGTINIAEAACAAGVRKIVFSSSGGSIYGDQQDLPITETSSLTPLSPYAVSKVAGELYLNAFSRLHEVECTQLAFSNVYGPRQDPHGEAGVVAIFAESMLHGRPTTLFGDGSNTRDYVYVEDVVDALVLAGGRTGNRQRLNISTGIETSDRDLHTMIAKVVGVADSPGYAPARVGDLRRSALDATLAAEVFSWKPAYGLPEGIERTVASLRS